MNIQAIPALQDNYIWLISHQQNAVCIDPSEAEPVYRYLQQHQLTLQQIWITHHHHDHTAGITELLQHYPQCQVYGNDDIAQRTHTIRGGEELLFADGMAQVWHTAGHTDKHLSFVYQHHDTHHVFCGDTLFSAGCGRVFTGTIEELFSSLQRMKQLPLSTLFYPAHEYTANNLRFALAVEPDNLAVQTAWEAANGNTQPTLPVSLQHELNINPFLRTQITSVQHAAKQQGAKSDEEQAIFAALREWKNRF